MRGFTHGRRPLKSVSGLTKDLTLKQTFETRTTSAVDADVSSTCMPKNVAIGVWRVVVQALVSLLW